MMEVKIHIDCSIHIHPAPAPEHLASAIAKIVEITKADAELAVKIKTILGGPHE